MASLFAWKAVLVFLSLLLILNLADAGHPVWETSRVEHPEWLSYETFPQGTRLWPDKTIKYAYMEDSARETLEPIMRSAHQLWQAAGLPGDFKLSEVQKNTCVRRGADKCLRIFQSTDGKLHTPCGTQTEGTRSDGRPKSLFAYWTDSPDVALYDAVSNIAHELGHAWGLLHEMQNRAWWTNADLQIFYFRCESLADYQKIVSRRHMTYEQIWDLRDGMCCDAQSALNYGFSGANWLPWLDHVLYYSEHVTRPTSTMDLDWLSIMMYPSYMGASNPGTVETADNGNIYDAVMLYPEHITPRWIPRNMAPSVMDVEGLKTLYNHRWPIPVPELLGNPTSVHYHTFKQIAPGCGTS